MNAAKDNNTISCICLSCIIIRHLFLEGRELISGYLNQQSTFSRPHLEQYKHLGVWGSFFNLYWTAQALFSSQKAVTVQCHYQLLNEKHSIQSSYRITQYAGQNDNLMTYQMLVRFGGILRAGCNNAGLLNPS